ncbi:MAG: class I SAM-dependent methyltransferase [Phycisphaerales bacterium]|nr:class I SAM-dependent methyltransferase [Phycisphaerales bacterium]
MSAFDLIATTRSGLEAVVSRELSAMGHEPRTLSVGRVLFRGDDAALARANLCLRAAESVHLRLAHFPARDFDELFRGVRALSWETWIARGFRFPVSGRSLRSQLSSVPACQAVVKKAIVERLRSAWGVSSPALEETGDEVAVEVSLLEDQATVALNTSGPGLQRRGYRTLVGQAQLKETLAAALVMLSHWRPERELIDPFCGTGTIPIEAAMIARRIAPGRGRRFAAERWPAIGERPFRAARDEARAQELPAAPARIIATDIDEQQLELARHHARLAGVEGSIHFQRRDFADLASKADYGCVVTNPPYGEQLGDRREAEAIARAMPAVFARLPTWSFAVLTALEGFEKLIGREADRRRKLHVGKMEVTYYQFDGPPPPRHHSPAEEAMAEPPQADRPAPEPPAEPQEPAPAAAPEPRAQPRTPARAPAAAFAASPARWERQREVFANFLAKRARHFRKWASRGVPCYRLYDHDIPEVPLIVEKWGDHLYGEELAGPPSNPGPQPEPWLRAMFEAAAAAAETDPARVIVRPLGREPRRLTRREPLAAANAFEAHELGLRYRIDLTDLAGAALPLDRRGVREEVRRLAAGRRVLCLFARGGGSAVSASAAETVGEGVGMGSPRVTLVDPSDAALYWAARNAELNGVGERLTTRRADPRAFLADPVGAGEAGAFDLIVFEPPALWPEGLPNQTSYSTRVAQAAVAAACLPRLAVGGLLLMVSDDAAFDLAQFPVTLPSGGPAPVRETTRRTTPEDFRARPPHRSWRILPRPAEGHAAASPLAGEAGR